MAKMKPYEVDTFQNKSEEESYKLLKNLDDTYTVIYEPSIGLQRKSTPDFIILSKDYGLIVLDVKYVKLDNIKESNPQTIVKKSGEKMKNFYQIVKDYTYTVNNQLVKELKENTTIVHTTNSEKAGKLTFPHSCGLLLFVQDEERYTKEDVSKILSLDISSFLIVNKIQNTQNELSNFLNNLNRPTFKYNFTTLMKDEILKKIYIDSDASSTDFGNAMSQFNIPLNKNFKEILSGTAFEKSKQLKMNLLQYTIFAENSIDIANKNLGLECENIIDKLKGYKQELEEEKFTVAVFGYFSTGKSTFLNTLMGTDKLPMDEDRSTATFTRLKHCDENEDFDDGDMQVIYKDVIDIEISYKEAISKLNFDEYEEKKYLNFTELPLFKDELSKRLKNIKQKDYDKGQRDNIKNSKKILGFIIDNNIPYGISEKLKKEEIYEFLTDDKKAFGIAEVIYYLNNDLLKDIEIVDTPGYGSENTMDTFKTQEFLKEANVIILLTEAKEPMSKEDEHKFLETYEDIYKSDDGIINTNNLFIIANKVDESKKSVEKIKESIKNKIEDNWEDSLVLKDNQIFTMSAKYHYEKNHTNESQINSENINDNDLSNFIESYSIFLTENKNKEIIRSSFNNIENCITEMIEIFSKIIMEKDKNINDIQNKKNKFETNKKEIANTYTFYSKTINDITRILKENIKIDLDKQKLNNIVDTEKAYQRFLENQNKSKNDATKENSKIFYTKLVNAIYKKISENNNLKFQDDLKENIIMINKQISKFSKELESEYGIKGLETSLSTHSFESFSLEDIKFEKGVINSVLDIIFLGKYVDVKDYAEKMVKEWENNTYGKILYGIDNNNEREISLIINNFNKQTTEIVDSIGLKLNDIEKNINKRIKDKDEYNEKIEKMESIFLKISKLKNTIKKQEIDLYN